MARQKAILLWTAVVAVVGAAGLALAYWRDPAPNVAVAAAPVPVVAATVKSGDVPIYLRGIGTVIAYNTVVVRSQIQGQIVRIAFTEGQAVRSGDLLAQIDPRPYQAQLDQVTAARDRDLAQLENARKDLDRYTPLLAKGYATRQLVATQVAQVNQLEGAVKSDEALIEAAKVQLDYTRLTSPIDGITGVRQVDIGNIIHPSDANGLVVVTQIEPISVIFTLPETALPEVQQQMAKEPLKVLAFSQDDKVKLDEGELGLANNEILQTSGTIQLKANFPNKAHMLWPGLLINVRLLVETRHNGLTIAASAVQQGPNGSYVYVIGADKKVEMRRVAAADLGDGQVLIERGVEAGEDIVTRGQYRLEPGSLVRKLDAKEAEQTELQSSVEEDLP